MTTDLPGLFKNITHGVYVIGVGDDHRSNAFTAAWVMQVSFDPPLLAFSINPEHYSYELLQSARACTINVLSRQQISVAEHFGRPCFRDKMIAFNWRQAKTGAPILMDSLAYFDCELSHFSPAGDHEIAVCRVIDAAELNPGQVMLYNDTEDMDGSSEIFPDEL